MKDERDNPIDPTREDLPISVLLRLAADGEITPEQQSRLDAHFAANPGDGDRVAFEIELRSRIAKTTPEVRAPQDVRDRVAALFHEEHAAPIVRSDRSFWARPRVAPFAIAAVVLLAATAAIILQPILTRSVWLDSTSRASVIAFVDNEHNRCAEMECASNPKWIAHTIDDAQSMAAQYLGVDPGSLNIDVTGFQMGGAGPCHVPGDGKSVHVFYRTSEDLDSPAVSLFIQRSDDEASDYACLCDRGEGADGREVLIWRRDGMVYFLRCPSPDVATQVVAALGGPTDRIPI